MMNSSHKIPRKLGVQEQLNEFTKLLQVAPFWHAMLKHSSISTKNNDKIETRKNGRHKDKY